jgi:hypothetical protein
MPGTLHADSISAAFIRTVDTLTPAMTAIGGAATGSAWRLITSFSRNPLARAVRM